MATSRPKKSTIVRTKYRALRTMFGVLERAAPGTGSRLALRLWCTPSHARPADGGVRQGICRRVPVNGSTVLTETWGSGPAVYLVHGWGGHRRQLAGLVEPLVSAGYQVISFDALSHGESQPGSLGPKRATLPEFADALTAVVAEFGPAHGVVAHSLGSAATALAVFDGLPAGQLVFVAPVAEPVAQTREFAKALGFGDRVHTGLLRRLEQLTGRLMSDLDIPARLRTESGLPPLLVLHDSRDRQVSHANATAIADRWPGARLITTEGLGHHRILTDQDVVRAVTEFVTTTHERTVPC